MLQMKSIKKIYGREYKKAKGYKLLLGESDFEHKFGGHTWNLPLCQNCDTEYHQLITLDLRDPKLKYLGLENKEEFPLISCLNCSSWWELETYKIDFENKSVELQSVVDDLHEIQEDEDKFPLFFPERKLTLEELDESEFPLNEDQYYDLLDCLGEEYICRLGDKPLFLTEVINEKCITCGGELTFIAEITPAPFGDEDVLNGVNFYFGEGVLYYYYCHKCNTVHVFPQVG